MKKLLYIAALSATATTVNADGLFPGFYAGGSVGYTSMDQETTFPTGPNLSTRNSGSNATVAVHAGYNFKRANNIIIGIELDYVQTNAQGQGPLFVNTTPTGQSWTTTLNNIASAHFRVGKEIKNTLVYGTLGLSYANITIDVRDSPGIIRETQGGGMNGYMIGVGLEKPLRNQWSMRGEIRHSTFSLNQDGPTLIPTSHKAQVTEVRIGLSRHF